MADAPDLGKKVGPLPLGVWIAVGGIGLLIGYVINRNANKGPTEQQLTESGVGTGGGTFLPINPPDSTSDDTDIVETNFTWTNKAIDWLVARGFNGVTASNALSKYTNGQSLDPQESAMISMVLANFGPPPDGVTPPPDTLTPPKPANLSLVSTISNTVTLSWLPSAGAQSYEVRWTSQFGEDGPRTTVLPTYAGTHDGRYDHVFYVRAVNEYGASDPASIQVPKWAASAVGTPGNPPAPSRTAVDTSYTRSSGASREPTYTVQNGDTLQSISSKVYGTPIRWIELYNKNAGAIEQAARANGKTSARGPNGVVGWYLFPGTVLDLR